MKEFVLQRLKETDESTLGALYSFDGTFLCYTLEDGYRKDKVYSKTRIPAGKYRITYRAEGRKINIYRNRFGPDHKMLWIRNIPGFEYVYLHVGNTVSDTAGCILVGTDYYMNRKNYALVKSLSSYLKVYLLISKLLDNKEEVWLTVKDIDYEKSSNEAC